MRKDEPSVSKLGLYILAALSTGPLHGYGVGLEVEQTSGRRPSAATLYENIAKLVANGFVERAGEKTVGEGKVRKLYRITGLGARVLNEELEAMARVQAAIAPRLRWAFE